MSLQQLMQQLDRDNKKAEWKAPSGTRKLTVMDHHNREGYRRYLRYHRMTVEEREVEDSYVPPPHQVTPAHEAFFKNKGKPTPYSTAHQAKVTKYNEMVKAVKPDVEQRGGHAFHKPETVTSRKAADVTRLHALEVEKIEDKWWSDYYDDEDAGSHIKDRDDYDAFMDEKLKRNVKKNIEIRNIVIPESEPLFVSPADRSNRRIHSDETLVREGNQHIVQSMLVADGLPGPWSSEVLDTPRGRYSSLVDQLKQKEAAKLVKVKEVAHKKSIIHIGEREFRGVTVDYVGGDREDFEPSKQSPIGLLSSLEPPKPKPKLTENDKIIAEVTREWNAKTKKKKTIGRGYIAQTQEVAYMSYMKSVLAPAFNQNLQTLGTKVRLIGGHGTYQLTPFDDEDTQLFQDLDKDSLSMIAEGLEVFTATSTDKDSPLKLHNSDVSGGRKKFTQLFKALDKDSLNMIADGLGMFDSTLADKDSPYGLRISEIVNKPKEFTSATKASPYRFRSSEVPQGVREQSVVASIGTPYHEIVAERIGQGGLNVANVFLDTIMEIQKGAGKLPSSMLEEKQDKLTYPQRISQMLAAEEIDPIATARALRAGMNRHFTVGGAMSMEDFESGVDPSKVDHYNPMASTDSRDEEFKAGASEMAAQWKERWSPVEFSVEDKVPVNPQDVLLGILGAMTTSKSMSGKGVTPGDTLAEAGSNAFAAQHGQLTDAYNFIVDQYTDQSAYDLSEQTQKKLHSMMFTTLAKVLPKALTARGVLSMNDDVEQLAYTLNDYDVSGGAISQQLEDALPDKYKGMIVPYLDPLYAVDEKKGALKTIRDSHKNEGGLMREDKFLQKDGINRQQMADQLDASGAVDTSMTVYSVTPTRKHNMPFEVTSDYQARVNETQARLGYTDTDLYAEPHLMDVLHKQVLTDLTGTPEAATLMEAKNNQGFGQPLSDAVKEIENQKELLAGKYIREYTSDRQDSTISSAPIVREKGTGWSSPPVITSGKNSHTPPPIPEDVKPSTPNSRKAEQARLKEEEEEHYALKRAEAADSKVLHKGGKHATIQGRKVTFKGTVLSDESEAILTQAKVSWEKNTSDFHQDKSRAEHKAKVSWK